MNRVKHIASGASLALILTVTASTGFVLLAVGFLELCDVLARTDRPLPPSYAEILAVSEQGTPIIHRHQWQPFRKTEAFNLEHQPIGQPSHELRKKPADLPVEHDDRGHWLRRPPRSRVQRIAMDRNIGECWYIVFDGNRSRRFYVQGIHFDEGQTVGYLGRNGFQATKPDQENQFHLGSLQQEPMLDRTEATENSLQIVVIDDRQLFSVNLADRTVDPLIEGRVVSMDRLDRSISDLGYRNPDASDRWAARTDEAVTVLELNGGDPRTFLIPEDLRDQRFEFVPLEEEAIYFTSKNEGDWRWRRDGEEQTRELELVWATPSGEVTERKQVSLSSSWRAGGSGLSRETQSRIMIAGVPMTLWSAGAAFGFLPFLSVQMDEQPTFSAAFAQWAGELWWVVLLVIAFCGWLAWLAFAHQRRQGEPHGWFWAVFVFLFGLPGYLGYRLHRSWPYSEPILAPEPTGLEVFAH